VFCGQSVPAYEVNECTLELLNQLKQTCERREKFNQLIVQDLQLKTDEYRVEGIICSSVRPILRIGEYSLVALQYRRIRYIGLRVSADNDTPAAITINSNLTRRLKHIVRVNRM